MDRSLWIHRRSNSKQISKDFLESGSLRPNYKTCNFTLSRPWCSSEIEVSANTVSGVVLGDVPEVFTHPFTQCSFYMSNVLFETYLTGDAVNNGIGFATTTSNGVVVATSDRTSDGSRSI